MLHETRSLIFIWPFHVFIYLRVQVKSDRKWGGGQRHVAYGQFICLVMTSDGETSKIINELHNNQRACHCTWHQTVAEKQTPKM